MSVLEVRLEKLGDVFKRNYPLIGILLGSALMSISLGPYSSWDSQLEFTAASGVVKWGLPYITYGETINMQPLGFYVEAFFLKTFGISYEVAIGVTTSFGVGCIFLLSKIGKVLYGRRTGLFAAALFALAPWQIIMSRVVLVDVQCLFLSLLFLLIGIYAMRKNSLGLMSLSGILFGFALLTKLFAVFMMIPLALFYIHSRPKNTKRALSGIAVFFLAAFLIQYVWYVPISGRGLVSVFSHDDFGQFLPSGFDASPFYNLSFFTEALGIFFISGFIFSVAFSLLQRKFFPKIVFSDMVFLVTIIGVIGFNAYLAVGQNMLVPYVNSIKYDYLTLPLFCLVAASLAKKSSLLAKNNSVKSRYGRLAFYVAVFGLYLLLMSMIVNLLSLNMTSKYEWLEYRVAGGFSYSFDRLTPILGTNHGWSVQFLAFALIQFSLLWALKDKLEPFLLRFENASSIAQT